MFKDERGVLTGPLAAALEEEFGVPTKISEHDMLMNALVWVHKGDVEKAFRDYIEDGRRNAVAVKKVFRKYPPQTGSRERIVLDFASGYGRVGRHFPVIAPRWRYTAMDIHRRAVAFNTGELGLDTLLSHQDPEQIRGPARFSCIFALSFFSHVRREHFVPWLHALHRLLLPGGVLMFTTHGSESHKLAMPQVIVDKDGYGLLEESEQHDLSTDYYIHAITYKPFVMKAIKASPGLAPVGYAAKSWWGHQDMYVLRNVAAAPEISTGRAVASDLRRIQTDMKETARKALRQIKQAVRRRPRLP
jgi:SAM-dependent methyltransferase